MFSWESFPGTVISCDLRLWWGGGITGSGWGCGPQAWNLCPSLSSPVRVSCGVQKDPAGSGRGAGSVWEPVCVCLEHFQTPPSSEPLPKQGHTGTLSFLLPAMTGKDGLLRVGGACDGRGCSRSPGSQLEKPGEDCTPCLQSAVTVTEAELTGQPRLRTEPFCSSSAGSRVCKGRH